MSSLFIIGGAITLLLSLTTGSVIGIWAQVLLFFGGVLQLLAGVLGFMGALPAAYICAIVIIAVNLISLALSLLQVILQGADSSLAISGILQLVIPVLFYLSIVKNRTVGHRL